MTFHTGRLFVLLLVLALMPAALAGPAPAGIAAAAVAPVAAPVHSPERAEILALLGAMERAILAGEVEAYLDLVVPADGPDADPVFRQEQINWARDLQSDHGGPPVEFSLALSEHEDVATFWPQRAEVELVMTWRMPPRETVDSQGAASARRSPERKVSFPAVFKNVDGRWLYAGENWISVHGDGIIVKCMDGLERTARTVLDVWPEVRAHVNEGFELDPAQVPVQEVKIYAEMAHLQASIYLSYKDSLAGWNEPGEAIKILSMGRRGSSAAALKPLLAHEYGHVATFIYGPRATDAPWWLVEGVAELASEAFSPTLAEMTHRMVASWAAAGKLAAWEDLADFRTVPGHLSGHVYRQGHHMIGYISDRFGRELRNQWLRAIAQGRSLDEATREVLKVPEGFAELDGQWRESVRSR